MKPLLAAAAIAAVALAATPTAAWAATLIPSPEKPCYRGGPEGDGEPVNLLGAGFSPSTKIDVIRNGEPFGELMSDANGAFNGLIQMLVQETGQARRVYRAIDSADPTKRASVRLLVSAVEVNLRPPGGVEPGRRLRIGARGFTSGSTLYAHIVRGRSVRNERIGRLRGPCRKLLAYKRLFGAEAPVGSYRVQFDTSRGYRARTPVKIRYTVTIKQASRPEQTTPGPTGATWIAWTGPD
jgi:hypothetical protein